MKLSITWPPVDQPRLLPGGEAFWDESWPSGIKDGTASNPYCEIADALARKLGPVAPTPLDDPGARLSGFANPKMADYIDAAIEDGSFNSNPALLAA